MYNKKIEVEESIINISSDKSLDFLENHIIKERNKLKKYCNNHYSFFNSHTPVEVENGPKICKRMSYAGIIAGIGPMGAVAGTISEIVLDKLISKSSTYSIVNNGGDIAFINKNKETNIICGIYAGNADISGQIALRFPSSSKTYGLATSSGKVGYSYSYGKADAVSIIAEKASIADAIATSVANEVQGKDDEIAIERGLKKAHELRKHFIGGLIIMNKEIGTIGKLPEIITIEKENFRELEEDTIIN